MAVSDAHYCFTMIYVGDAGCHRDGGVLANSNLGKAIFSDTAGLPPLEEVEDRIAFPFVFVEDAAFPLQEYHASISRPTIARGRKNFQLSSLKRETSNRKHFQNSFVSSANFSKADSRASRKGNHGYSSCLCTTQLTSYQLASYQLLHTRCFKIRTPPLQHKPKH